MSTGSGELVVKPGAGALVAVSEQLTVKKRPPKKPLEEEEFTEALTTIIRRDFFPDVAKLESQLEFIEASESNDYDKLREISERFATTTHTPAQPPATPATFETPSVGATPQSKGKASKRSGGPGGTSASCSEEQVPEAKKLKPEESKGLDQFLSKYQSEDDASFGELMEKAAEEHRLKHAWLRAKEIEYSNTAMLEAPQQRLAITDGSETSEGGSSGGGEGEVGGVGGGAVVERRRAGLDSWSYTAKNSLMYIPDGVEQSTKDLVEKATKGREILHSNTRLSREFLRKREAALQAKAGGEEGEGSSKTKSDKIGVDGKTLLPGETPSVNGYKFVATPQIHPGVDASPLMTWGSIDGTPFHLETDLTPHSGPTFKMPKTPKREEIAFKLVENANKANKERKKAAAMAASPALLRQKLGATPTSDRLQMLSPAARKLMSRTATPTGFDKALRASYTPKRTPGSASPHSTPKTKSHSGSTPQHHPGGGSTPSLTDNLLKLR